MSLLSNYGVRAQVGEEIVIPNGLQIHLDAGNPNSYPGSGTTWLDISGNGRHASIVSMTFNSGNGGFLNSASSGYVDTNYTMPTSNFTAQIWYRRTSASFWTVLWASEIWNNSTGFVARMESTSGLAFGRGGGIGEVTFSNSNTGNWQLYTYAVASNGSTQIYINNNLVLNSSISLPSSIQRTIKLNTRHENSGAGLTDQRSGQVAEFMFYNRALTAAEIQQNFNVTKARFGL